MRGATPRSKEGSRTPRSGDGSVPSAPNSLVSSLQRSLSFGKRRERRHSKEHDSKEAEAIAAAASPSAAGTSATTPPSSASSSAGPSRAAAPPKPQPSPPATQQPHVVDDSDEEERPIEFNSKGVPLITSLPEILAQLESVEAVARTQGANHLARLVDGSSGDQACLLGEYMREAGAIELLVTLLGDEEDATIQLVLMALGNACSDAFDVASTETRARLRGGPVLPLLLPLLDTADRTIQLYAVAALQNMCKDLELALQALQLGATRQLERCCAQQPGQHRGGEMLGHFAAGALLNMDAALAVAEAAETGGPSPRSGAAAAAAAAGGRPQRSRAGRCCSASLQLSDTAVAAIARRHQHDDRARQQKWRRDRAGKGMRRGAPPRDAAAAGGSPSNAPRAGQPQHQSPEHARHEAPPTSVTVQVPPPAEEPALQTRIPFVDLAQVRAAKERREQREEHLDSPPGSPKSTSSKTSWASFFTAKSAQTSTSVGSYKSACTAAEESV